MSRGDFFVLDPLHGGVPSTVKFVVASGTTGSILAGEWVYRSSTRVVLGVDGMANTSVWVGVAQSDSTETSSADGEVHVYYNPNYIFRGRPTTASNLATSLLNTQVTLDVASGTNGKQTVDENDTTNGTLLIIAVNTTEQWVDVQMAVTDHLTAG